MIQIDQNAQVSSATSRMFSTNLPCIKVYHDDEWHVASPSHKGCSHRASNFRRPNVESRIFENAVDIPQGRDGEPYIFDAGDSSVRVIFTFST